MGVWIDIGIGIGLGIRVLKVSKPQRGHIEKINAQNVKTTRKGSKMVETGPLNLKSRLGFPAISFAPVKYGRSLLFC